MWRGRVVVCGEGRRGEGSGCIEGWSEVGGDVDV